MQIEYTEEQWKLFNEKRKRAKEILEALYYRGIKGYAYGSIARGDVKKTSDIDIIVFEPNILELDLLEADHKYIIQATPVSTPKAYISLNPEETEVISFPLSKLKKDEEEFYYFGGLVSLEDIINGVRKPGINKELKLIIPNKNGHEEIPLKGNEDYATRLLKISITTINEREKLLMKREDKGRTGVFLKYELATNENFEEAIRELSRRNKFFRRALNDSR
ncbi:nucleotidyltransferase domain-containing protein [Acidianus ambivalens]|uniref:protein adenylyltransferase n=1 Tax=Acidianus ambivalens TaxID=2283 RepID=A0A650CYG1_ACIAM|nr:nucleotidyltransferase domain-containing protein [Acidianus ambivalens]MQL54666.1 DNA polymerase subunit beta [Acidianus ambivalens]QGR22467.1 DNA polymerase subunit beta [Acidianus ambivalens]